MVVVAVVVAVVGPMTKTANEDIVLFYALRRRTADTSFSRALAVRP